MIASFGHIGSCVTAMYCATLMRSCESSGGDPYASPQFCPPAPPTGTTSAKAPAPRNGVHFPSLIRSTSRSHLISATALILADYVIRKQEIRRRTKLSIEAYGRSV